MASQATVCTWPSCCGLQEAEQSQKTNQDPLERLSTQSDLPGRGQCREKAVSMGMSGW